MCSNLDDFLNLKMLSLFSNSYICLIKFVIKLGRILLFRKSDSFLKFTQLAAPEGLYYGEVCLTGALFEKLWCAIKFSLKSYQDFSNQQKISLKYNTTFQILKMFCVMTMHL